MDKNLYKSKSLTALYNKVNSDEQKAHLKRWEWKSITFEINLNQIRAEKIKDFFILDEGGYSIYHRAYTKSKIDDDLISGFISAIFSFSKELSIERIHVMDMQESRFIYEYRAPFIFVLNVVKDGMNPEFGKVILNQVMDFFETFYNEEKLEKYALAEKLKSIKIDDKLDQFINKALMQDYFKNPSKILDEIDQYLVGLFGSVGTEITNFAIEKVCKQKTNFKRDQLSDLVSQIERSLERKISPSQAKMITDQIRNTFLNTFA